MKSIKYFRTNQYGLEREFVTSECASDAVLIHKLTGQKTITPMVRHLIGELSAGEILFVEVVAGEPAPLPRW